MPLVSVIIPYFQREPGVLGRALDSIFSQDFQDLDIIIVDDASPLPATEELRLRPNAQSDRIRVIRQQNMGPGGARNTGLGAVGAEAAYVAFLDSDDAWHPLHLSNALGALAAHGGDCYFATIEGGEGFEYHSSVERLRGKPGFETLRESPLTLHAPRLSTLMLADWSYLHMSCMVLARDVFTNAMFEPDLRMAAEDVLFFHDCLHVARRPLLSAAPGALRGFGDNIFHGMGNDSPSYLEQQRVTVRALGLLSRRPGVGPAEIADLKQRMERARAEALWGQAQRARLGHPPQWRGLAAWARRDPALLRSLFRLGLDKVRARASP